MLGIHPKFSLATVAVVFALLTAAGPASAATHYQHNQTDVEYVAVTDGTSNTIMFAE